MNFIKKIITLLLVFVLLGSSLSARVVEVYPALNTLPKWKISQNIPYYSNMLNFEKVDNKVYPISTELTKNYIGDRLVMIANNALVSDVKKFNKEINNIVETVKSFKDPVDPISIMKSYYCNFYHKGNVNKCYNEIKSNFIVDDIFNNLSMAAISIIVDSKGMKKSEIIKAVMNNMLSLLLKDEYIKTHGHVVAEYWKVISENPYLKYIFTKTLDYTIDFLTEYIFAKNYEAAKKAFQEGFMTRLSFALDAANVWSNNIANWVGVYEINKKTDLLNSKIWALRFIQDYVYKYNMDIEKMANDNCDLSLSSAGEYQVDLKSKHGRYRQRMLGYKGNDLINHFWKGKETKPHTFFQLFVIYGITHGYTKTIDLKPFNNLNYLWLAAYNTLSLIEKFGDGGNLKVYLNVDKKGTISIDDKTYIVKQLYWMLPFSSREHIFKEDLSNLFGEDRFFKKLGRDFIYGYNPFQGKPSLYSKQHININDLKTELKLNKQKHKLKRVSFKKVINYKGFIEDNSFNCKGIRNSLYENDITYYNYKKVKDCIKYYQKAYSKKIVKEYSDIIIPILYSKKPIVNKYLQNGILTSNKDVNIDQRLYLGLNGVDLKKIFIRYSKIHPKYFRQNVKIAYKKIKWTSPVRRQQLFQFLIDVLQLNPQFNYSNYRDAFPYQYTYSTCNSTYEGCILKSYNITNGAEPNGIVSLYTVLVMLDRIEKNIGRY